MNFLRRYRAWFVTAAVGLAIAGGVVAFEYGNYEDPTALRMLCDGAFVAGVILACFGALALVGSGGAFDAMGFAVRTLLRKFSLRKDRFESRLTYGEYKAMRRERKGADVKCVLFVGVAYLALAAALLGLYYS